MIGQSLEQMRKDLRLMPTPALMEYKKNPGKQAIDGMPMDMLAGLELSRRAQLQQEQMAKMAPNPQQMPTVVDQAAMGLAGIAQQPTPQMPGAPAQFQSSAPPAPPQTAPQGAPQGAPPMAPPQQMAQAPTGPQMPTQPTQQQPQRLAAGGIASLGDMQNQRDQQSLSPLDMSGGGQPLMMARGGIVAFKDNRNQPVDSDMPASYGDPMGGGGSEIMGAASEDDGRNLLERLLNKPADPEWKRKAAAQAAAQAAAPVAPAAGPIKGVDPTDMVVSKGGGPNMDAILRQMGSGGGGVDMSKMQAMIDRYMKPTEQETAYQTLVQGEMERIRNRQSPEVSEADRKRIIDEQFQQNQATSRPYYEKMQKMLDEESAANKARYADKDADAMIRAGLRGLSSRKPGMQGFFEGAVEGLDYHDKVSELEASASRANRQANMDLIKSRMSDEKGDREASQRYFDSYQKNKRDAETYEIQRSNILINAQKGLVDTEGKRERAGMGLQMGMDKLSGQMENNSLRNQLGLMKLMSGSQPKALTVNEKLALEKRVGEVFGNPTSPEFQKYVGANYTGGPEQLALDLKNKRVTLDKLQPIIESAKRRYVQNLVGGTRSSAGATSYDQAASDLLGQ